MKRLDRTYLHMVSIVLILTAGFWIVDSFWYFSCPGLDRGCTTRTAITFIDALGLKIPPHHLFVRLFAAVLLLLCGILIARYLKRQEVQSKGAEAALQDSQAQLTAVLDGIPALIAYIDAELRYVYVNQSYAAWYGCTPETLIGKRIPDLLAEDVYQRALPNYQAVLSGETVTFENRTRGLGEEEHVVSVKLVPHRGEGESIKGFFGLIQDITEQVKAEAKLRMLGRAVEQSNDGIAVADMEGNIRFVNSAWATMHGDTPETLLGQHLSIFHTEAEMQSNVLPFNVKVLEEGANEGEMQHLRKDGTTFPTWMTSSLLKDEHGIPTGLVGIAHDITERKHTEEALIASEHWFRQIVEHTPLPIAIVGSRQQIEYINPKFTEVFGYTIEEIPNCDRWFKLAYPDPDYRAHIQEIWETETAGIDQVVSRVFTVHCKDNVFREINFRLVNISNERLFILSEDITARRQAEETLERTSRQQAQLLEAAHNLITSLDIDKILTRIGMGAREILEADGCTIYQLEADGQTLTPLVAIEDRYKEALLSTTVHVETSYTGRALKAQQTLIFNDADKDSKGFHIPGTPKGEDEHLIIAPLLVDSNPIGAMCLIRPGTPEKVFTEQDLFLANTFAAYASAALKNARSHQALQQAEAALREERVSLAQRVEERTGELREANAELAKALNAKDGFLATMSHELRTPLSAILTLTELLSGGIYGSLNPKQHKALDGITESGKHLLSLITDILDVSKIEAGRLEIELKLVDVKEICEASITLIQQQAAAKDLKVTLALDKAITHIIADPRRLKQILVNLLSNAIKFTPQGGQLGLEVDGDPAQQSVSFTVWDTGIGIAPEDQARVFEPFIQLDSTLTRTHEGTGLGLTLVDRLAKLHDGSVMLESSLGHGSRFIVSVPWTKDVPTPEASEPPLQSEEEYAVPTPEGSFRVLIAEDNLAISKAVAEYLETRGYQVAQVHNGTEAITQAQTMRPDLILMDIQMPEMDGLEATRRIRADRRMRTIPIIALTALVMPGDSDRCLAAGANAYLGKPFTLQELEIAIAAQLQQGS